MKIALAQLNYTIGDIDSNVSLIIDAIRKAEAEGADLVLFAEYAVSGTPAYDLLRKTRSGVNISMEQVTVVDASFFLKSTQNGILTLIQDIQWVIHSCCSSLQT